MDEKVAHERKMCLIYKVTEFCFETLQNSLSVQMQVYYELIFGALCSHH